jgi:MFS family permease
MQLFAESKTVLVVGVVTFLLLLGSTVYEPIRPLFIVGVGATTLELGLMMALFSLVSVVTRVPVSAVSMRLGRWRLLAFSIALGVATSAIYAFVYDPLLFYPLLSFSALSWSVFSPISVVIISDRSTPSNRGAVMGIYFSSIGAALLAGPLLCSLLTLFIGFRELFLASAVFPALALVLFLIKVKAPEIEGDEAYDEVRNEDGGSTWASIARIFRVRNVAAVCYAQVAFAISYGVFTTLFSIYAEEDLGLSASVIALIFSVRALTNFMTRLPAGRMSDDIGRRKLVILSHAIIFIIFAVLPFVRDLMLLGLLIAIYGIGWGMRVAPDAALVSESVPPKDRPMALAILMTMFDLGSALGSLLVGGTASLLTIPNVFLLCAPILLSGLLGLLFLTKETLNYNH